MQTTAAAELLASSGIDPSQEHFAFVNAYLVRRRRARWVGLACGLALGLGPLAETNDIAELVARLLAGYLLGVLLSDLIAPRPGRGEIRAASLRPRSVSDLVPLSALALPWLTLVPVFATPLLAIGWHPRGATHDASGDCFDRAYWPHTATLFFIAVLAGAALVVLNVTLHRLAHRAQPAEDTDALQLDRALRARSARAAIAAGTALGLSLISLVGKLVYEGIHSYVCSRPAGTGTVGNVYSWAGAVNPWLQNVSLTLLLLAIPTWMICQRLPITNVTQPDA
jgi:hypothetical protein